MVSSSAGTHLAISPDVESAVRRPQRVRRRVPMPPQTLATRVESLERRVTSLETLPERMDRVESQIVQLRKEMRDEFSEVRKELRGEINALGTTLRGEIDALGTALREEMAAHVKTLREEIRAGDEDTRHLMRVLHEEVISRFALMEEGRIGRGRRKRKDGR
jgi:predicted  nucleic acid-binding Zn-ribbon protein